MKGKVVTVGIGWLRYEGKPDIPTSILYKTALSRTFFQSVRDNYAEKKLIKMGYKVINTGCPSLWDLTIEKCKEKPRSKGENVLMTLTKYRKDIQSDRELFQFLKKKL